MKAEESTEEGFVNEALLDEQVNELQDFKLETSTSSCHMDDVTAFVLGGSTSRWWMMRKHINLMTKKEMNEKMPFYSWQCLTLEMPKNDVYLVIKSEERMVQLLKLLIYELNIVDGNRGTA